MMTFSTIINTSNPEEGLKKLDKMVEEASIVTVSHGDKYYRHASVITDTVVKTGHFDEILLIRAVEFVRLKFQER